MGKRKKGYYIKCAKGKKAKHNHALEAGVRGFLITCNSTESQAVKDAYHLLNEYADTLYGPEKVESSESESEDVEEAVRRQVQALTQRSNVTARRFQSVETGTKNCIFIKTTVADPGRLAEAILSELERTRTAKSRFISKLIPVLGSCKAELDKLQHYALDMVETHLQYVTEFTYSVEIKIRNNADLTRKDVMDAFTQAVSDLKPRAKVKLDDPQYVLMVNVIKRVVCVSVLQHFRKYSKYNLQQIVATAAEQSPAVSAGAGATNDAPDDPAAGDAAESAVAGMASEEADAVEQDATADSSLCSETEAGDQQTQATTDSSAATYVGARY